MIYKVRYQEIQQEKNKLYTKLLDAINPKERIAILENIASLNRQLEKLEEQSLPTY